MLRPMITFAVFLHFTMNALALPAWAEDRIDCDTNLQDSLCKNSQVMNASHGNVERIFSTGAILAPIHNNQETPIGFQDEENRQFGQILSKDYVSSMLHYLDEQGKFDLQQCLSKYSSNFNEKYGANFSEILTAAFSHPLDAKNQLNSYSERSCNELFILLFE